MTLPEFKVHVRKMYQRRRIQERLDSIASRRPADMTETSIREAATEEEAQMIRCAEGGE